MTEHTPTPYKWHPKSDADERNGSIYSEQRPGHAYAVAMQPRYVENNQWSQDAAFIVKAVNNHEALVVALTNARARIEYLGAAASNEKHFLSNQRDFLPEIDAALQLTEAM
jgi:hypothetical protein